MGILVSEHARFEMTRRQISEQIVIKAAENPQQVVRLEKERMVYQTKYYDSAEGKEMLLRVICEKKYDTLFVITAYKTSKINKYWMKEAKL